MIKITITTDLTQHDSIVSEDEAEILKTKILSQMNNGNTVVFRNRLINPKYIRCVVFEEVE